MTICNMSIEGGARAGLIAPDETTFQYIAGAPHAPKGAAWDAAVARWRKLPTDEGAVYDKQITIDARPAGTHDYLRHQSGHGDFDYRAGARPVSDFRSAASATPSKRRCAIWGSKAASRCWAVRSNVVFIGSCTNSRISDLAHRGRRC